MAKTVKKGVRKVMYPDYQVSQYKKDEFINRLQQYAAGNEGLGVLAEEYHGRRKARKFEQRLLGVFLLPEAEAKVEIEGLGTYRAVISDIRVALDDKKEPSPMVEVMVFRENGKEFDDDPEIYFDNTWSWNLMEGINGISGILFDALEHFYRKDFYALPEEMREQ